MKLLSRNALSKVSCIGLSTCGSQPRWLLKSSEGTRSRRCDRQPLVCSCWDRPGAAEWGPGEAGGDGWAGRPGEGHTWLGGSEQPGTGRTQRMFGGGGRGAWPARPLIPQTPSPRPRPHQPLGVLVGVLVSENGRRLRVC